MGSITAQQLIEFVLCIFLPPLAIFIHDSELNIHVLITFVLIFFFWLPAVIYGLWYCFFRA
ncbi:unnamed protein product [Enterobius vermicularis]|uniref:YqaE/Pmp3 family membrane protein n=1 Tax=Enterobius vermicularis TaxID=51028 RepID=A0A0N4V901_ENTVE|nr:unnamed protein product [Enterobius vermicularis]